MHEHDIPTHMDLTAASAFVDLMVGNRVVAANAETGEDWGPPTSPEIRAFLVAALGDGMPISAYDVFTRHQHKGRALVALLRVAADAIERGCGRA